MPPVEQKDNLYADQEQGRNAAVVIKSIQATGAMFVLGGGALALDVGGIGTMIFNDKDAVEIPLLGGFMSFVGLLDIFVIPRILARKMPGGTDKTL